MTSTVEIEPEETPTPRLAPLKSGLSLGDIYGPVEPADQSSYSVVRRLKKCAANGAATARIPTDQISAISTGCCMDQAGIVPEGFGFPHKTRVPAITALTGFHVAIACNHPGMCCVGTNALDTKVIGNSTMNPNDAADSGLFELSPTHAATHVTA